MASHSFPNDLSHHFFSVQSDTRIDEMADVPLSQIIQAMFRCPVGETRIIFDPKASPSSRENGVLYRKSQYSVELYLLVGTIVSESETEVSKNSAYLFQGAVSFGHFGG